MKVPPVVIAVAASVLFNICILESYPLFYGEEIQYSESALSLSRDGNSSLKYMEKVSGYDNGIVIHGPLNTLTKSVIFKLFGFGIWQVRVLSFICLLISLFLLFSVVREVFDLNTALIFIALMILSTDYLPKKSGRPDAIVILSLSVALWLYYVRKSFLASFMAGFVASLSIWFHLGTAPCAFLSIAIMSVITKRNIKQVFSGILLGIGSYFVFHILPNYELFMMQIKEMSVYFQPETDLLGKLMFQVEINSKRYYEFFVNMGPYKNLPLLLALVCSVVVLLAKKDKNLRVFILPLIVAGLVGCFFVPNFSTTYVIFLLPIFMCCIAAALSQINKITGQLLGFCLFSYLIFLNFALYFKYRGVQESIKNEFVSLAKVIPNNSNIMCDISNRVYLGDYTVHNADYSLFIMKNGLREKYRGQIGNNFTELSKTLDLDYIIADAYFKNVVKLDETEPFEYKRIWIQNFIDTNCYNFYSLNHPTEGKINVYKVRKP